MATDIKLAGLAAVPHRLRGYCLLAARQADGDVWVDGGSAGSNIGEAPGDFAFDLLSFLCQKLQFGRLAPLKDSFLSVCACALHLDRL